MAVRDPSDDHLPVASDVERSPEEFPTEILYDSAEDNTGVFEVLLVASNWYPEWTVGPGIKLAEETVLRLMSDGSVALWYWDEPERLIRVEQARAVPGEWRTWFIPHGDGVRVGMNATKEGRGRYPCAESSNA
jgi:hypothetical protein